MAQFSINDGWLNPADQIHSPNFYDFPNREISLLVIHCISLPPGVYGEKYIDDLFTNNLDPTAHPFFEKIHQLRVSSHLLIERSGKTKQYVSFNDCAHHAGVSNFEGRTKCNDFSIGIELEGALGDLFTNEQYSELIEITKTLMAAYPQITTDRIVGHSDIAPGRKADPGEGFDWKRYKEALY